MWDPLLAPSSCWHGVTTTMFGNCGVGFAPVKPQHRAALMELMEGVEEIPGVVLADGLTWDWETFPDFLDALERKPRAIDVAAQVAHLPLRVYVMGDRAVWREPATGDDIAEMQRQQSRRLRPAPSASPRRAPTRTRRRPASSCPRAMLMPMSFSASRRPRRRGGRCLRHEQRLR
jgi:N-acyl-D-aspartate/D-glutamate deacylase